MIGSAVKCHSAHESLCETVVETVGAELACTYLPNGKSCISLFSDRGTVAHTCMQLFSYLRLRGLVPSIC